MRLLLAVALALAVGPALGQERAQPQPACAYCAAGLGPIRVPVWDGKGKAEHACCGLECALRLAAARYPISIITIPAAAPQPGEVVKVVRTGKRWTALPRSAVFLWVEAKDKAAGRQAFVTQARYIQYLTQHPELAARQPRPLKLGMLMPRLAPPVSKRS